jgi:transcription elongation factor Elf1
MSGYSEAVDCPRCGSEESLERSIDKDDVNGFCLECGYSYKTVYENMTLEQVNEEREAFDMEPITALKPAVEGWTDETP